MLSGSCLCCGVRYEIRGEPRAVYHCHCGTCRKANGASFATNLLVDADAFEITAGRALLAAFESSPAKQRYFCSRCGSPVYSQADATRQLVSVRSGTLDGNPPLRPSLHTWVASKASWTELHDGLTQLPRGIGSA
jgi:hypothetical protein